MNKECIKCKFFLRYHSDETHIDCTKWAHYLADDVSKCKHYTEDRA